MKEIFVLGLVVLIVMTVVALNARKKAEEQLHKYLDIKIGMSEEEMLDIMGKGYNKSLLKNNRIKYEWRINATSYSSSFKGISVRSYSGVKKVTIYTKNGFVEEVKPHNV